MRVTFIVDTDYAGRRYQRGDAINVSQTEADRLIRARAARVGAADLLLMLRGQRCTMDSTAPAPLVRR